MSAAFTPDLDEPAEFEPKRTHTEWGWAGFQTSLLPITVPGGPISPYSRSLIENPENMGKAPGELDEHGAWFALRGWGQRQASEADLRRWERMGAGVGLLSKWFPGIDIDVYEERFADLIQEIAEEELGTAPIRVGQAPKRLLMYGTDAPFGKMTLHIKIPGSRFANKVEVLGAGQQFVVEGIHARTGQPYHWPKDDPVMLGAEGLSKITAEQVVAFLDRVDRELTARGCECSRTAKGGTRTAGGRSKVDQDELKAPDLDELEVAMKFVPNDEETDYDTFIKIGVALKAAFADDPDRGLQAYQDWAARWKGGHNDPEVVDRKWRSFNPPFTIGAEYISDKAREGGYGTRQAQNEFEDEPEPEPEKPALEPLDILGSPALTGWPELDETCLPEPLLRYVKAEAVRLNADPCAIAAHCLAACSTSIGDAWSIKPKKHDRWTQQARLWVAVVKPVGARGTDTIKAAYFPVTKRDMELRRRWQQDHAAWSQRQEERKKKKDPTDPEPVQRRLVTNDITVEKAADLLANGGDNAKLAYVADELGTFLHGFTRYKKSEADRGEWLQTYDGGPHFIDRIMRGTIHVPNWSVVIAGNIQERRLKEAGCDLINDGLFQRFMVVHAKPGAIGVDDDAPLNAQIGSDYLELHEGLAGLQPPRKTDDGTPAPCWADDDARAARQRIMRLVERLQHDPTLPDIIRETAPKWSGLHARLTLIFHLIEVAERQRQFVESTPDALARVCGASAELAANFIRKILLPNLFRLGFETLPEDGSASHARWIAEYVLARKSEQVTARELGRANRKLRGKAVAIVEAMAVLVDAGWATAIDGGRGRVDSTAWRINPLIHTRFASVAERERERRAEIRQLIRQKVEEL